MERLNELVTPAAYSEKLHEKLGKLWNDLNCEKISENGASNDDNWKVVFSNIRQLLVRVASERDFPIDFNFGETPFSEYANRMSYVDSKGQLKKLLIRDGIGNIISPECSVYIHFRIFVETQQYPFSSSEERSSEPRLYELGSGQLRSGFETAITTMKIGEKSHFLLAPEIAYGKQGMPPLVPPDAEILFEVELCDIVRKEKLEKRDHDALDKVHHYHELANKFFKAGILHCAAINYRKAEDLLSNVKYSNPIQERARNDFLLKVIMNQMITFISDNGNCSSRPREALNAAIRAFELIPAEAARSHKLKYNLAKTYLLLNEEEKAFDLLKGVLRSASNSVMVRSLYNKLEKQLKRKAENETKCWNRVKRKFPEHQSRKKYGNFLRGSIRSDLENCLENPLSNIGVAWNYTSNERVHFNEVAKKMNLTYEEHRSHPANVLISIHKKGEIRLVSERNELLNRCTDLVISDDDEEAFIGWDVADDSCKKIVENGSKLSETSEVLLNNDDKSTVKDVCVEVISDNESDAGMSNVQNGSESIIKDVNLGYSADVVDVKQKSDEAMDVELSKPEEVYTITDEDEDASLNFLNNTSIQKNVNTLPGNSTPPPNFFPNSSPTMFENNPFPELSSRSDPLIYDSTSSDSSVSSLESNNTPETNEPPLLETLFNYDLPSTSRSPLIFDSDLLFDEDYAHTNTNLSYNNYKNFDQLQTSTNTLMENNVCVILDSDDDSDHIPTITDQPSCSGINKRNKFL